jgi:hypothetical protein
MKELSVHAIQTETSERFVGKCTEMFIKNKVPSGTEGKDHAHSTNHSVIQPAASALDRQ